MTEVRSGVGGALDWELPRSQSQTEALTCPPGFEMRTNTWALRSSPDSATEQHWLLRNDGEFASEVSKANVTDSHSVNLDAASGQLHQAEEGHPQGGLP